MHTTQVGDVVFDHCFMISLAQLRRMATQREAGGIEPWHFEQHQDEAVFIPAGCPHQVRGGRWVWHVKTPVHCVCCGWFL